MWKSEEHERECLLASSDEQIARLFHLDRGEKNVCERRDRCWVIMRRGYKIVFLTFSCVQLSWLVATYQAPFLEALNLTV